MSENDDQPAESVIIVRRRADGDGESHHGGVWKIAYADFMTAMMAFFLVMWLVNASDKQTVTQIASYFNPLRLTDRQPSKKGLEDPSGSQPTDVKPSPRSKAPLQSPAQGSGQKNEGAVSGDGTTGATVQSEARLFRDPNATLSALAMTLELPFFQPAVTTEPALRDPFDPLARGPTPQPPAAKDLARLDLRHAQDAERATSSGEPKGIKPKQATDPSSRTASATHMQEKQAELQSMRAEVADALAQLQQTRLPSVDIDAVPEGILISLTDGLNYGMFAIASAEPRPELVAALQGISRILAKRTGMIIIKGHTDGRPFKSDVYDNWRLSSSRAHMTYHMLLRGGLPEARFERIEGHADRHLKVAADPAAAQNRRIEILLRNSGQ